MTYYIFVENEKINGAGQARILNEGIINFEVNESLYNAFVESPDMYIWDGSDVVVNPNYEEEQTQKERERLNMLSMTKREMFLGLYQAKGITPDMLKAQITDPQAFIEFEYANDYYRGNPLIDVIGSQLGFTSEQLDKFFETKDYHELITKEVGNENTTDTEQSTDVSNEVETKATDEPNIN